jgi:AraC-like DNA-binding protein
MAAADVAARFLIQKQYQDLARKHLGELRQSLFAESTGLHFHIVWTSCHPAEDRAPPPTAACDICSQLANQSLPSTCCVCGELQQEQARNAGQPGHRFTCGLGVSNYWFSITVRNEVVGTAYVQALDKANHILRSQLRQTPATPDARFLSRDEFDYAARLLQFIVQSTEATVLAELSQADAAQVRRAMKTLKQEQERLHEHVQRLLPEEHPLPGRHPPPPIVQRMLESVHRHYTEPFTLQDCAHTLGRNAAYLSDLFAHAVGLPFKTYLTELRLEKAKALLGDPKRNINEVALAIGYSSADRFRLAFKQHTGLSPRDWRETMRHTS